MALNSSDFLLYKGETALGHSKSTNFALTADLVNTSTKDSNGWKEYIVGLKGGSLRSTGLTDYSDSLNYEELVQMLITKEKANFFFKDFVRSDFVLNGYGFIQNVSEKAEANGLVSFEVEIKISEIIGFTDQRVWNTIFDKWNEIALTWNNV